MQLFLSLETNPFTLAFVFFLTIILLIINIFLWNKISKFTKGQDAKSLEDIIHNCIKQVEELKEKNELIAKHSISLEERVSESIRNTSTIRYKAFESGSSNQSFSTSFINEKGDGVVISSLHNRDRISVFAKPINKFTSEYDLTDEEKEVIEKSKTESKKSSVAKH